MSVSFKYTYLVLSLFFVFAIYIYIVFISICNSFKCWTLFFLLTVEHYLRCQHVRNFAAAHFHLRCDSGDFWDLVMLARCPSRLDDNAGLWARVALLHYSVYTTVNSLRHRAGPSLSTKEVRRALHQAAVMGTRGHLRFQRLWRQCMGG